MLSLLLGGWNDKKLLINSSHVWVGVGEWTCVRRNVLVTVRVRVTAPQVTYNRSSRSTRAMECTVRRSSSGSRPEQVFGPGQDVSTDECLLSLAHH